MKTKTYTIGLDLGDRKHHACVLDAAGEIVTEEVLANTAEVITAFSQRYPQATFVMETGTHCSLPRPLTRAPGTPRPALRSGPRLTA